MKKLKHGDVVHFPTVSAGRHRLVSNKKGYLSTIIDGVEYRFTRSGKMIVDGKFGDIAINSKVAILSNDEIIAQ